ncbi:glutathione-regulated potassium-efflux system ancillary protein KefG [Vibrio sp. VB16]|nr:glutathione-regulated potassium-efflux system ancillary protein KefG [Vibrio sp. VB16]UGA54584.1 glutathione-regulated potassium-efflux system ancillary protein KefG [Vibrio sp. VB16]
MQKEALQGMIDATMPLPRILVIFVHPEPGTSVANNVMLKKIQDLDHVTIHDLYAQYPDFFIDVQKEHQLLLSHDIVVFQHPLFMYSCPALLKEWMDRVLGKGFAFGDNCALKGKHWRSVITTGGAREAFAPSGYNKYPMEEILQPFELTAGLCRMNWMEPIVLHWARHISDVERLQHAEAYRHWLMNPWESYEIEKSEDLADGNDE